MKNNYKDIGSVFIPAKRDEKEFVFSQLFREHFHGLSFFARSITGQELFAQDIVQECFIKIWNRRMQITNLTGLKSYLYAAVKNDCISYLRSQSVKIKKQEIYVERLVNVVASLEQEIVYDEIVRELYDRLERLPGKMMEVIKLYYLEEKSWVEIGRLLQKSPDTMQHQRKAALRLLRDHHKKGIQPIS